MRTDLITRLSGLPEQTSTPRDSLAMVLHADKYPAAIVWIATEEVLERHKGDPEDDIVRGPAVQIHLIAKATTGTAMDNVEAMAAEVERRMIMPFEVRKFEYENTEFGESRAGEHPTLTAVLSYGITYTTVEGDPDDFAP